MEQYLSLLEHILTRGKERLDRTGVGTVGVFGYQLRCDLAAGFPLLTTKKLHLKSILYELLWMLGGHTNTQWLNQQGVTIWNEWATEEQTARFGRKPGDLGPVYGHQWRNFGATKNADGTYQNDGIDQIVRAVETIKKNPFSRRIIVSSWNPAEADEVALPPCHTLFQFYVAGDETRPEQQKLSCQMYQRSADAFLGVPFNLASYALLTMMMAQVTGKQPGEFVQAFGDLHLYRNHLQQTTLQLSRTPRPLPTMVINQKVSNIFDFKFDDFRLVGYDPHPHIKAEVAI